MSTINQLSAVDSLQGGDQFPLFSSSQGDARKASLTTLTEYMNETLDIAALDDFKAELLSTAVGAGASLVQTTQGFDVQETLNQRGIAHAQNFWRTIRAGQDDVFMLVYSDSGWNDTTDPLYRWVDEVLPPEVPTHTIIYRLWVDGSGWQSPITIQTGTGPRTIYIDNASVPGSGLVYPQGANEKLILADNRSYNLVLVNHGHNFGSGTSQANNYTLIRSAMAGFMALHAKADFLVTLQHPWLAHLGFSRSTQAAWRQVATEFGCGIIDIGSRFEALGDLDDPAVGGVGGPIDLAYYVQDGLGGLHPNATLGSYLALSGITPALAEAPATGTTAMLRPFSNIAINLLPNPAFTSWSGSTPDSHVFTNVTPTKSVAFYESGLYSMALTCGAGTPTKSVDLSNWLPLVRGKWVSYLARIWVPDGLSTTAGRVQLVSSAGAANRSSSSQPTSVGQGGWRWVMASHQVLDDEISLIAILNCGASDGSDSGKTFYIDRELVTLGTMPGELDPLLSNGGFLFDLYNFRQTGIPTGFTGTLALSGTASNTFTVTSGTAGLTRAYGTFNTVPGRTYRVAWGTRSVTGAAGCTISIRGPNGSGGSFSVTTTNGSPTLTGITVPLVVGQPISGTGIPTGTTIIGVGSGTATMSVNATATGTINANIVTATVGSNQSFVFAAALPTHSFSINGGTNVTGFVFADIAITELFSGISPVIKTNLMEGRNANGTVLDATGSATNFAISSTAGTSLRLLGASATGLTRTNTALFEVTLPSSYIPGRDVSLRVNANRTGTGTAGTNTVDFAAYRVADDGTQGADLVTTAAQAITATAADYTFAATGTGLVPGDKLLLSVVTVMQETGAVNPLTAQVNSIRVS